jgi:hypothetical protein
MKKNDEVLIIETFWRVDEMYIGRIGTLAVVPTKTKLGAVLLGTNSGRMYIYVDEQGCVPVSSLMKELC